MGLRAHRWYPIVARLRDLTLGTIALLVSAPFILLFGAIGRRSTGGSALFRQTRVGKEGQEFKVAKLRTLSVEAPSDVQKGEAEHLATSFGAVLRRLKIDELPQFWNVVKGDMSLVGPRPIIPEEYSDRESELRLAVRPGLTGLWQLSRVREQPFHKNPEYDLFYLANRSIIFDFWLMWRTVLLILIHRETKIRLAARMWERNAAWRELVPERARSIPARDAPLRSRLYIAVAAALLVAATIPGAVLALSARGDLLSAQAAVLRARGAAVRLDPPTARAELEQARLAFQRADSKLSSPATLGLGLIPGLNNNLQVPQTFARLGGSIVAAGFSGLELLEALPFEGGRPAVTFGNGAIDLAPFTAAEVPAERLQGELHQAQRQLNSTPSRFLLPPVADARARGIELVTTARREADTAVAAAFLLPRVFGADGPRNWVIGAENNAELRGRGGYIGSLGMLSADEGRLQLVDFKPTSGLPRLPVDPTLQGTVSDEYFRQYGFLGGTVAWQNLLMSPDFPTGAQTLLANLDNIAGMPADGLIALDPIALSYLLRATGPVSVPGIPEQLTADNIVDWSLNRIYFLVEGEHDERKELLSVIASTVWSRLLSGSDLNAGRVVDALAQAFSERHLLMYSARPDEQSVIEQLGIAGTIAATEDDYLLLVGQNIAENKMDFYLQRDIDFTGALQTDGDMQVEVTTTVTHTAPAGSTFPDFVAGSREDMAGGRVRHFLSLFVPHRAQLIEVKQNGVLSDDFENAPESRKRRLGTWVEVGPGESQTVSYKYLLPEAVFDNLYYLTVQNQATVRPDTLSINIQVPENMTVTEREGFKSGSNLVWSGEVDKDLEFAARIETPLTTRVMNRVTRFLRQPVSASAGDGDSR